MDIPVYLFTGFLESGKTTFIQETLQDPEFNSGEKTLLLVCEEGEVEFEPEQFVSKNVVIQIVDDEQQLTKDNLKAFQKKAGARRVIAEYNGMWQLGSFYNAMPKEWILYQEMCFANAEDILTYNRNMRNLVADKLAGCELVVFNRCSGDTSKEELHKMVRSVSRKADIAYEYKDRHVEYDDIKDPLPFDVNADIVKIGDGDYAVWYYDLMDDKNAYNGKTLEFLGIVAKDRKMPRCEFAVGRHIMTCCVEDIRYGGVVAQWENAPTLKTGDWVRVTGKIKQEFNEMYGEKGPVLKVMKVEKTTAPKDKVVTLY